jgi:hypothetical protein
MKKRPVALATLLLPVIGACHLLVSPPLSRLTFETNRDGQGEVYLMRETGHDQLNLSNDGGEDENPL